jgi:hypothetical protein
VPGAVEGDKWTTNGHQVSFGDVEIIVMVAKLHGYIKPDEMNT